MVPRRYSVIFSRTDVLLKRLRASRLDNNHDVLIHTEEGAVAPNSDIVQQDVDIGEPRLRRGD